MGHGQVALFRMGDSLEHIEEWSKFYSSQIEPKDGESKQKDDAKVEGPVSFEDLRGKKSHYYFILDHYKTLLATTYEGNLDDFIAAEFPKLHLGIGKYAVHPLIHIGYGYSVKSATLVCEGFAWLHYTYLPLILSSYSTDQLGKLNFDTSEVNWGLGILSCTDIEARTANPPPPPPDCAVTGSF